jgi:ABC-type sulfate transport system permease component
VNWQAIWLTMQLASATTAVLFALGLPLDYWLAVTRWRGKFLIEAVVALPLVLPPTVLGFYLLIALGPHSPLGRLYEQVTGGRLPFSVVVQFQLGVWKRRLVCQLPRLPENQIRREQHQRSNQLPVWDSAPLNRAQD